MKHCMETLSWVAHVLMLEMIQFNLFKLLFIYPEFCLITSHHFLSNPVNMISGILQKKLQMDSDEI